MLLSDVQELRVAPLVVKEGFTPDAGFGVFASVLGNPDGFEMFREFPRQGSLASRLGSDDHHSLDHAVAS